MSQEFLNGFHAITSMCLPISFFILLFIVLSIVSIIRKGFNNFKNSINKMVYYYGWKFVVLMVIAAAIFLNSVFYFIFSKEDMTALYEKKEYTQSYEAYLYESENSDPYFFIMDIAHSNGTYTITKLHLPFFTEETEIEYNNTADLTLISISHWEDYEVMVRRGRVADSDSFYRLSLQEYDYTDYSEYNAETETESRPYYVTTQNDPLNMRELPGKKESIVGQIPKGADIEVDSVYENWGHTYWDGISGWVNLNYCTPGNNPNPTVISLDTIVYFTEDGKRFHTLVCPHIQGRNTIATSVYYAYENHGKTPCQVCLYWLNMEDLY